MKLSFSFSDFFNQIPADSCTLLTVLCCIISTHLFSFLHSKFFLMWDSVLLTLFNTVSQALSKVSLVYYIYSHCLLGYFAFVLFWLFEIQFHYVAPAGVDLDT